MLLLDMSFIFKELLIFVLSLTVTFSGMFDQNSIFCWLNSCFFLFLTYFAVPETLLDFFF